MPFRSIALGLAVCFRSNVWNIGAEGQFVIGAVVAEFVSGSGATQGLAWRLLEAGNRLRTADMLAALACLMMMGLLLNAAVGLLDRWRGMGLGHLRLAVNLSARQCHGSSLLPHLDRLVAEQGFEHRRIGDGERVAGAGHFDRMLRAGLRATVNSDDPAYFGGYVADNYRAVAAARGLGRADLVTLARNSFLGSFLPDAAVAEHLARLDAYVEAAA